MSRTPYISCFVKINRNKSCRNLKGTEKTKQLRLRPVEELRVNVRRNLSTKNFKTLEERTVKKSLSNRSLLQNFCVNRHLMQQLLQDTINFCVHRIDKNKRKSYKNCSSVKL